MIRPRSWHARWRTRLVTPGAPFGRSARLRRDLSPLVRLLMLAATLAALAFVVDAHAGEVHLRDDAHLYSAADRASLRDAMAHAPFDARIVTTSNYAESSDFSRYVGTLVSEPNMVVLGLDPEHHHVQVHFGTGTGIPRTSWTTIEHAGNASFQQGQWERGSEAILRAATDAVASGGGTTSPVAEPARSHGPSFVGPLVLILLVVGVIGAIAWVARRRGTSGPGYGASPYGGPGYGGPPQGPYYGPGVPPQGGGMGPLGGSLIGAGLGGLAGYELGKMEGEREEHAHEEREVRHDDASDRGSYDAGGGGSDWSDPGDTGGGGGFDGGGDAGGGGSDF